MTYLILLRYSGPEIGIKMEPGEAVNGKYKFLSSVFKAKYKGKVFHVPGAT